MYRMPFSNLHLHDQKSKLQYLLFEPVMESSINCAQSFVTTQMLLTAAGCIWNCLPILTIRANEDELGTCGFCVSSQ